MPTISHRVPHLDHIGLYAFDMEHVATQYERLGFRLTPLSQHASRDAVTGVETRAGIANRCAMLRQGYLELLAIVDPALDPRGVALGLQRYAGLHIVAFGTEDAAACANALSAQGFTASLSDLRRSIAGDGGPGLARFTQVRTPAAQMPEGLVFTLRHETPELLWQPQHLTHPNGAVSLEEVAVVVADPWGEPAQRYARYLGVPAAADATGVRLALPAGSLRLMSPQAYQQEFSPALLPALPFPGAIVVGVEDLARTEALLRSQAVAYQRRAAELVVGAESAGGCVLVFRAACPAPGAAAASALPS